MAKKKNLREALKRIYVAFRFSKDLYIKVDLPESNITEASIYVKEGDTERILTTGGSGVSVEPLSVTENGTYTAKEGKAYSPINVNVPNTVTTVEELIWTNENPNSSWMGFVDDAMPVNHHYDLLKIKAKVSINDDTEIVTYVNPDLTSNGWCLGYNNRSLNIKYMRSFNSWWDEWEGEWYLYLDGRNMPEEITGSGEYLIALEVYGIRFINE